MRALAVRLLVVLIPVLGVILPAAAQSQESTAASPRSPVLVDHAADTLGLESPTLNLERAATQDAQSKPFCCDRRHFWPALGEVGIVLVIPWYFNRHVSDDSTAILSFESWKKNILEGMEWDHDDLKTNMFAHPFHGSLYFNAARSNGYNFWQSAAWSWGGSFLWEMFGENNPGAVNDWISTAVGGIALGEGLHRTARMIRNNSGTGFGRSASELGAFLIDPMGGASRLFRGEWSRVGPNPEDRFPEDGGTVMRAGVRVVGEDGVDSLQTSGYFALDLRYGDPFREYEKPFDFFQLSVQINGRTEKTSLGRLQMEGVLFGTELKESDKAEHVFHFTQHYDYVNNNTLETGGSSLGASFLSRYELSESWNIVTKLAPSALLIWGAESEYADFTKRTYDFGSGLGFRGFAGATHRGRKLIGLSYLFFWQHTLNGAVGDHLMHYLGAQAAVHIYQGLGLGAQYWLTIRDSNYRDYPDVTRKNPQLRVFAVWFVK
jgi:hypothetical protein